MSGSGGIGGVSQQQHLHQQNQITQNSAKLLAAIAQAAQQRFQAGATPETDPEFARLVGVLRQFQDSLANGSSAPFSSQPIGNGLQGAFPGNFQSPVSADSASLRSSSSPHISNAAIGPSLHASSASPPMPSIQQALTSNLSSIRSNGPDPSVGLYGPVGSLALNSIGPQVQSPLPSTQQPRPLQQSPHQPFPFHSAQHLPSGSNSQNSSYPNRSTKRASLIQPPYEQPYPQQQSSSTPPQQFQQAAQAPASLSTKPHIHQSAPSPLACKEPPSPPQPPLFGEEHREALKFQIMSYKQLSNRQPLTEEMMLKVYGATFARLRSAVDLDDVSDEEEYPEVPRVAFGIDLSSIATERDRRVKARMQFAMHSALAPFVDFSSLRSQIDGSAPDTKNPPALRFSSDPSIAAALKVQSILLQETQRDLRHHLVHQAQTGTQLLTISNRNIYKRIVKYTVTPELSQNFDLIERSLRAEQDQKEVQKLKHYNDSVIEHGRSLLGFQRNCTSLMQRLGSSVQKLHERAEKEEQKRAQRVALERMNALKANDEEAYLRLIDQAKDKRITQILQKTTNYLAGLSAAVLTQQEAIGPATDESIPQDSGSAPIGSTDYYQVAHRIQEVVTEQSSLLVGGKLKDYQLKGLQWMISLYNNRLNGILADEMGLGKTIQTISLITYLIEKKKQIGPYLIIIPLATMTNWAMEFEKWAPSVAKLVFKGSPNERKRVAADIKRGEFNVLITTYEYIIKEKALLSKIKWVYMIIDEGHRMKNSQSKLSTTLMQHYQSRYRVILTGTPLQNNLPELWALLNFILPKIFNSVKSFDEWFSSPFTSGAAIGSQAVELNEEERLLMIKGLHKVLRPFLLRRLKKDVEAELPDKVETVIKCPMSALQRKMTDWVKVRRVIGPFHEVTAKTGGIRALNNLVMQFRKICNHPFIFPEVEALLVPTSNQFTNDLIFRTSGKFELLDRILPKFLATGHRVLMFFQMTQIMDIVEDFFRYRGWKHLRLDGHIKGDDRSTLLKTFNAKGSEYDIFILSTRAGGLGLNLQTADTVIIFDSDWNPHQDLQAQDRAHRIGQTKEVRILRLITTNSVEEHILAKAQQKLDLDGKVIQAGKFDNKTSEKEREELLRLLFDNEKDEKDDGEEDEPELTDEQLNEIIARSPEELATFTRMDEERRLSSLEKNGGIALSRLLTESELPEVYKGDVTKPAPEEEADLKPRERKAIRYSENLTDEQWLNAVEEGNLEEVIGRQSSRAAKRELKRKWIEDDSDDDGISRIDDDEDDDDFPAPPSVKKRSIQPTETVTPTPRGREKKAKTTSSSTPTPPVSDLSPADCTSVAAAAAILQQQFPKKRGRKSKAELAARAAAEAAAAAAIGRDVYESASPSHPPSKRRKQDTELSLDPALAKHRASLTPIFEECMSRLRSLLAYAPDGSYHQRSYLFEELPLRRQYRDYYSLIKCPIALNIIDGKIQSRQYQSVAEFDKDLRLMFSNARIYNQEGSEVVKDANEMERVLDKTLAELAPDYAAGLHSDISVAAQTQASPIPDIPELQPASRSPHPRTDKPPLNGRTHSQESPSIQTQKTAGSDAKPSPPSSGSGSLFERQSLPRIKLRRYAPDMGSPTANTTALADQVHGAAETPPGSNGGEDSGGSSGRLKRVGQVGPHGGGAT
ncbi:SNF2 family N-terminal domain-containing protein [Zopfochytrium polystomum]|nr:SNF2 family N-terminal domain-containing protein [Zopfochytrium polystomum]